jgi:Bacterial Ig-like domain (group 2)
MTGTTRNAWLARLVVGAVILLDAACESPAAPHGAGVADVPIRITAITVGTPIQTLVVEVSAGDLPKSLLFNLTVANGVASGTIKIPPGSARTIHVTAVDDQGDVTHDGSVTVDVRPGQNPPVQIKLAPRSGQVPISVTFGNFGVVVTPATATIDLASTSQLQLGVVVTDVNGQPINGQVGWATSQPAVATVSASGLVTGVIDGNATIVATYEGVAGLSAITVAGGPSAEICDGLDNNLDGQIDEGLQYCLNGVPAPNTDGNSCQVGFVDANGDPADGCEISIAPFGGDWSLAPPITTTCTGGIFTVHPTIDRVTTSLTGQSELTFQFSLVSFGVSTPFSFPALIDVSSGTFSASHSSSGQVSAIVTINGAFTGPDAFAATVQITGIAIQESSIAKTCLDIDQSVTGTRLVN